MIEGEGKSISKSERLSSKAKFPLFLIELGAYEKRNKNIP